MIVPYWKHLKTMFFGLKKSSSWDFPNLNSFNQSNVRMHFGHRQEKVAMSPEALDKLILLSKAFGSIQLFKMDQIWTIDQFYFRKNIN